MTDLEPCLHGCDIALAEAERLIAMLSDDRHSLDPELAATRARIESLRHEVDRLRGMTTARQRRKMHPEWIETSVYPTPWCADGI